MSKASEFAAKATVNAKKINDVNKETIAARPSFKAGAFEAWVTDGGNLETRGQMVPAQVAGFQAWLTANFS